MSCNLTFSYRSNGGFSRPQAEKTIKRGIPGSYIDYEKSNIIVPVNGNGPSLDLVRSVIDEVSGMFNVKLLPASTFTTSLNLELNANGTPMRLLEPFFMKAAHKIFPGSEISFLGNSIKLDTETDISPKVAVEKAKELPYVRTVELVR